MCIFRAHLFFGKNTWSGNFQFCILHVLGATFLVFGPFSVFTAQLFLPICEKYITAEMLVGHSWKIDACERNTRFTVDNIVKLKEQWHITLGKVLHSQWEKWGVQCLVEKKTYQYQLTCLPIKQQRCYSSSLQAL